MPFLLRLSVKYLVDGAYLISIISQTSFVGGDFFILLVIYLKIANFPECLKTSCIKIRSMHSLFSPFPTPTTFRSTSSQQVLHRSFFIDNPGQLKNPLLLTPQITDLDCLENLNSHGRGIFMWETNKFKQLNPRIFRSPRRYKTC